jgi:hypothetical protein
MGFDADWILIGLIVPEPGEVSIYVAVELKVGAGLESEAIVLDTLWIVTNVLHSFFMTGPWAVCETSTLAYGELDLRVSIGGEVHEHANDRGIVPGLLMMRAGGICSKWSGESGGSTGVAL